MASTAKFQTPQIPLEDRIPTFAEINSFDAGAAWDRLTPTQQRETGMLAVRYGTIGQCNEYFHETLGEVRTHFLTSHWMPQVQATAVWPVDQITAAKEAADESFQKFYDHFDPLWPTLFGWASNDQLRGKKRDLIRSTSGGTSSRSRALSLLASCFSRNSVSLLALIRLCRTFQRIQSTMQTVAIKPIGMAITMCMALILRTGRETHLSGHPVGLTSRQPALSKSGLQTGLGASSKLVPHSGLPVPFASTASEVAR